MTSQRARPAVASDRRQGGAAPGVAYGPWLCALIAAAAAVVLVIARWATWAKHNIGNFILVGRHFANPAQVPRGIPIQPTYGYDGQYFYRLALDPADFSHTAFGISVDHTYRFMRIGYPALTWLLSAGQHSLVPDVLVGVNILAVGALGYLGGVFAVQGGRNALWGLLLPAYFGVVTSVSRDTAEPLAAACLLAGLLALRRRRPVLAGLLLAYAALTRETAMVGVGAIAIMRVLTMLRQRRAPGREDVAWVLPSAVFVAWQVVIYAVTGSVALATDGGRNAGLPFSAPVRALVTNLRHVNVNRFDQYDLWLLELGALILCCVVAIITIRASKAPGYEKLALFLYIAEICVVNPNTWNSLDADMRSFIEVYLMAVILLLSVPAGRLGARFGWVLPVIGVWGIAAIAGVVQRRLTISFSRHRPVTGGRAPGARARRPVTIPL
ncbi:MAG: AZOBR_p60025 family cell surface glycopolymer formation protein [Trebonia sp.]